MHTRIASIRSHSPCAIKDDHCINKFPHTVILISLQTIKPKRNFRAETERKNLFTSHNNLKYSHLLTWRHVQSLDDWEPLQERKRKSLCSVHKVKDCTESLTWKCSVFSYPNSKPSSPASSFTTPIPSSLCEVVPLCLLATFF